MLPSFPFRRTRLSLLAFDEDVLESGADKVDWLSGDMEELEEVDTVAVVYWQGHLK